MSARLRAWAALLSKVVYARKRACAQIALLGARIGPGGFVGPVDVDRAAPILRRLAGFKRAFLPLRIPVVALQLFDGAVKKLDLDGAVVVVVGDDLEERAIGVAIPVADNRLRNLHGSHLLTLPRPFRTRIPP